MQKFFHRCFYLSLLRLKPNSETQLSFGVKSQIKLQLLAKYRSKLDCCAGTILGQGGQDRVRQSREREIKFFTEFGAFFCPEIKRSLKKGLRRIRSVFCPKNKRSLKKKRNIVF